MTQERQVDQNALRTNQAFIIVLLALAFLFDTVWLVACVATVMIIGTIWPQAGLFKLIYRYVLVPLGIVKPDVIHDNPEPHRFAQGVGGAFTVASTLALLAGGAVLGWLLSGIVMVLASLNLFAGWCAGCTMYYWFSRLGVPGFRRQPLEIGQ